MIIHVDMDAFYASVEQRDRPELQGKPVVVGGTPQQRGVVAAASYEARKFGIHSAMPAAVAHRRCPQAVFLPSRIGHYARVSRQIREIFNRYTPLIEPLSLDEAFLDVAASEKLFGPAAEIAAAIKRDIRSELMLPSSAGVAPNKFLAKIASDLKKPDALVVVEADGIDRFLAPLPIERMWGVGRQGSAAFHRIGIHTFAQLRRLPQQELAKMFGKQGDHFWRLARGIDDRPVVPDHQAKSISHETTFAVDVSDLEVLRSWLLELTEQVARRLRRHGLSAQTVQLKIRFADFSTITRAQKLNQPTNQTDEFWQAAAEILDTRLPPNHLPVRLLGMGVSGIDAPPQTQGLLFDRDSREKQQRLDQVADEINERFGSTSLKRGGRLMRNDASRRNPSDTSDDSRKSER